MIIKTRLASDSSLYRLSNSINDCPFQTLLNDLIDQWNLPKDEGYSLIWREDTQSKDQLILDKDIEWQLFCRLHPADPNKIVELQLIPTSYLNTLLPINSTRSISATSSKQDTAPLQESKPPVIPKYAFHSVEPQPLHKRQLEKEKLEGAASQAKMQEPVVDASPSADASTKVNRGQEEEEVAQHAEPMSAFERVMARSRMQGEGLNHFFGTVMARRAGHSSTEEEEQDASPEATSASPQVVEPESVVEEESTPQRKPRSREEIEGTNSFLENAWQERLRNMGHGPNGGSPYARIRHGKGKERQEGDVPPIASSSHYYSSRVNGASHSEEAIEALGPLQGQSPVIVNSSGSVFSSRPGSSSGLSTSGGSAKTGKLSRFLRKGQFSKQQRRFASQPSSLYNMTPSGSEAGIVNEYKRQRSFSFRSLSDALSRDRKPGKESTDSKQQVIFSAYTSIPKSVNTGDRSIAPAMLVTTMNDTITKTALQEEDNSRSTAMAKQHYVFESPLRPSLLRASQSAPLTSTAVNLFPVGGITLHISSLDHTQPEAEADHNSDQGGYEEKRNLFDLMLPREIRLKCFKSLVRLYEEKEEEERMDLTSDPSAAREDAIRQLIRMSRVSRTWQSLLLDGQLWTNIDSTLLGNVSNGTLLRLARSAGPFIKKLDLHQAPRISSSLLVAIASAPMKKDVVEEGTRLKSMMTGPSLASTKTIRLSSLTHLNLQGCRQISTKSLHSVLVRLPSLLHINLSNLDTVTNNTCLLLGSCYPNLLSLDISRCLNTSGKGVIQFIQAAQGTLYDKAFFNDAKQPFDNQNDIVLPLEELRAAACAGVDSEMMALIGNILRSLQVLDLSYSSDLRDDMIAALVAHPGPAENDIKTTKTTYQIAASPKSSIYGPYITLTPRQAGGDIQSDEAHHRHLLTSLRHICLSSCRRLTDRTCIYLAFAVPNLQYLELANIGAGLRDEGLVKLFKTTPLIQRIDLEGASEVTEITLEAITPDLAYVQSIGLERNWSNGNNNNRRRSAKKNLTEISTRRQDESSASAAARRLKRQRPPPPGAWMTHLVLSSVNKPDADCLLNLVRRCPRLIYLQLDDTKANDSILKEFISLCRLREVKGAYLSLVDCRALSRSINSDVQSQAGIRPREGRHGRQFQALEYSTGTPLPRGVANSHHHHHHHHQATVNEYDDRLIVVKTFFNWEIRSQQRRIQQRRNQRAVTMLDGSVTHRFLTRARRDSLGAALSLIGGGGGGGGGGGDHQDEPGSEGMGRWSRITSGLIGQGDEADDARICSIM